MYKFVGDQCYFYIEKDGKEYHEPFIANYSKYLIAKKKKSIGTVRKHITAIHRFWMYSLFSPNDDSFSWLEFSFSDWLAEYQNALERGIVIKKIYYNEELGFKTKGVYYESKPLKETYYEFVALEKYFIYLNDKNINPLYELSKNEELVIFSGIKDYRSLDLRAKHNHGSGYGLKAQGLAREALAEKLTVFSEFKERGAERNILSGNKIFPFAMYDSLLEMADDRSKLLYLLCGATSARVGQALSLTMFDVDMQNKKVYLVDPRTDRVPTNEYGEDLFGQQSRKRLLAEYGIDFRWHKYKRIGFKYPIPIIATGKQDLFFIQEGYREMFFETYARYSKTINSDYPMVFQTSSNHSHNIWLPSNAGQKFKKHIDELKRLYPEQANFLNLKNKFHSLRHMFGQFMANMAYENSDKFSRDHTTRMPDLEIRNTIEIYKEFTAKKMGHSSKKAVDIYFNSDFLVDSYIQKKIQEKHKFSTKMKETIMSLRVKDGDVYFEREAS